MLVRMWSHGNFHSLLVEIENGTDTLEESWTVSYKTKYTLIIRSSNSSPCIYPKKLKTLVQLSSSVMSDYLWPYGLQHARLPCPLPATGACSDSCPLSWWCHPTFSPCVVPFSFCFRSLPASRSFPKSQFLSIRWPKYWSFGFSVSLSNEYSGLISFRMDGLDLLAIQGTLKSLLQHHSSKASVLQCSAFFIGQLSHPYMTTGKTIALIRQTFVSM